MSLINILILLVLVLLVVINAVFILWFVRRQKEAEGQKDDAQNNALNFLQKEIQNLRDTFDRKIGDTTRDVNEAVRAQFSESQKLLNTVSEHLASVKKEVGSFSETNKQVVGFAEQLKELQDVLKNPKQRGVLGEYYLETVLQNVLPPKSFKMQYGFSDGEIVDAVVFVKDKIIPVDSKFSLENYNRMTESTSKDEKEKYTKLFKQDLKLRIDETSKYIRPSENTVEFAFMFIPSEGVYYDLLVGSVGTGVSARDLIEYAFQKKVIIVSPTSFLAYLQTVLQGLKMLKIEESAKEIRKRVEQLGKHIGKYEEYYQKLGKSLSTTVNHYNAGYKELGKIDKDVLRITGEKQGVEPEKIDKPTLQD